MNTFDPNIHNRTIVCMTPLNLIVMCKTLTFAKLLYVRGSLQILFRMYTDGYMDINVYLNIHA